MSSRLTKPSRRAYASPARASAKNAPSPRVAPAASWPAWAGIRSVAMEAAEMAKVAALSPKAGPVPTAAMTPPAIDAARICTSRAVDHETEFAASRCSGVVSAGMTAFTVGLKNTPAADSPAATT